MKADLPLGNILNEFRPQVKLLDLLGVDLGSHS